MYSVLICCRFYLRDIAWAMSIASLLGAWYVSRMPMARDCQAVRDRFSMCSVDVEVEWRATIDVCPRGFTINRPSTPGGPRVFEVIVRNRKSQ